MYLVGSSGSCTLTKSGGGTDCEGTYESGGGTDCEGTYEFGGGNFCEEIHLSVPGRGSVEEPLKRRMRGKRLGERDFFERRVSLDLLEFLDDLGILLVSLFFRLLIHRQKKSMHPSFSCKASQISMNAFFHEDAGES